MICSGDSREARAVHYLCTWYSDEHPVVIHVRRGPDACICDYYL